MPARDIEDARGSARVAHGWAHGGTRGRLAGRAGDARGARETRGAGIFLTRQQAGRSYGPGETLSMRA
jgi:hypothetical protein